MNGHPLIRSRTPNTDWIETAGKLPLTQPFDMAIPAEHLRGDWQPDQEIWIVCLQKWAGFKLPVTAIDRNASTVTLPGKLHAHRQEKANRFWIENAPGSLDSPGEWRIDKSRNMLQIIPPEGTMMDEATVSVPVVSEIIRLENSADVTFRGLSLGECDDDFPVEGEIDSQAAAARRGAIRIVGCENVTLEDCRIANVGGYAIDIGRGSKSCAVRRCEISSMGAGGVRIGETRAESDPESLCTGHKVEDCDIHDYGQTFFGAVGVIVFQSSHNHIVHNAVHHGNYTAISVGWTWGYRDSPCHHNVVEWNHLHHLGGNLLSDMGGVYLLGPQEGTVVRRNLIHDVDCHEYGGWGLYTDEGSSNMLLEENIVYRCSKAGFHQHYGQCNTLRNNLIVDCGEGGVRRSREEEHLSFTFENNVVINETPAFLHSNWKNGNFLFRNNLYFSLSSDKRTWNGQTWEQWQAAGQDAGSRFADPMLVDSENPAKGLQQNSPARELGITIVDLSKAGPRMTDTSR